ncbi:38_t:CDS:2 [Paraglomus occultum]|uniref:38_t:CDS:1 n=1 Tax=Paraglomus occultum TaxID=144539 RepID=A0A9N8WLP7_9GLOM|nr:38_t:CDS:2 [Paraglomus occultum]
MRAPTRSPKALHLPFISQACYQWLRQSSKNDAMENVEKKSSNAITESDGSTGWRIEQLTCGMILESVDVGEENVVLPQLAKFNGSTGPARSALTPSSKKHEGC